MTHVAAPRTEMERVLLEIWSSVLKTSDIGIHDDFLDLGGESLSAMRCINRIRKLFGVELSLDLFFLEPAHIAELASQVERMRGESAEPGKPPNAKSPDADGREASDADR